MIRLFAHRGFAKERVLQNSIASLNAAHKKKFGAIEFDIWFLEDKLFLSHDRPKKNVLKILPSLSDYFAYKNDFCYWMDFKNLDEKNADQALKMVKDEINKSGIKLDRIYFAPFITDYKIAKKVFLKIRKVFGNKVQIVAVCEKLKNAQDIKNLRDFLTKNKIHFLSIFHELVDRTFVKIFPEIEIFAWTVNDLKRVQELEKLGVKNFATDSIVPK
ncbi:MAG: glycerophosphodiester phosphodiesterase [Pseudomonadota bacterium]